MSDTKTNMTGGSALSETIRKELGSATNRDFLARMSSFKPEVGLPDRLNALLGALDEAEASARQKS